jgi:hypothetical protein
MRNVSPTVFLQLMEMEAKTCTIRILSKKSGMGGILYFIDGDLLDVRVGEIKGLDAAYKIFGWDDVTFFMQNECAARENIINSPLQPIIMKAVGMKDEEESPEEAPDQEKLNDVAKVVAEAERKKSKSSNLDNSGLHEEFIEPNKLGGGVKPPSQQKNKNNAPVKSKLKIIEELLYSEVGPKCGLRDIYQDDKSGDLVDYLTELGALFNLGELKVGYIDSGGETDQVIIPGQPLTVIEVDQKCPQDKIIQVLSQYQLYPAN